MEEILLNLRHVYESLEWAGWPIAILTLLSGKIRRPAWIWFKRQILAPLVRQAGKALAKRIRRWLEVAQTVSLTQEEYDSLPQKDPDTIYVILDKADDD